VPAGHGRGARRLTQGARRAGRRVQRVARVVGREVFPQTKEQRCCFDKQANVLAVFPKSAHSGALAATKEIYNAEDADKARAAITAFEGDHGAKLPKAVAKISDDADVFEEHGHQGAGLAGCRARDGVQADRGR